VLDTIGTKMKKDIFEEIEEDASFFEENLSAKTH